ncbi:MAG: ISNCY family transposase [Nitrososphaeraceae archaeon]
MSQKERKRIKVLDQKTEGKLTVKEASGIMGISERQTYRLLNRYKAEGDRGIIHRLRGKHSNRGYPKQIKQEVIEIYWKRYRDFGPTLFSEKLKEYEKIEINHETLRRWMRSSGIITSERKKRPHRKKRERRKAIGEMLQFDGSHHDWFEGRGPVCCLLHAIDDASSKVFIRFSKSEDTESVLRVLKEYCEQNGIPNSIYTDRYGVYYAEKQKTDFQLAMEKLSVETIYAKSPEAKGRVERGNRTLQDRLVKEMRLRGISNINEANKFLDEYFIDEYNKRFAQVEALADIHRTTEGMNLDNVFCYETKRQVRNDYTITLEGNYIQLEKSETILPIPGHYVIVRKYLDGSLHIFNGEEELEFTELKDKPRKKKERYYPPKSDHPWKRYPFGKARYAGR